MIELEKSAIRIRAAKAVKTEHKQLIERFKLALILGEVPESCARDLLSKVESLLDQSEAQALDEVQNILDEAFSDA